MSYRCVVLADIYRSTERQDEMTTARKALDSRHGQTRDGRSEEARHDPLVYGLNLAAPVVRRVVRLMNLPLVYLVTESSKSESGGRAPLRLCGRTWFG